MFKMRLITPISLLASIMPYLVNARWTLNDTCPTEIQVTIPNYGSDFGTMVSVHEALLHCPNITSLDLRVTLIGCSSWPDRWNFPFHHDGGEKYPTLRKLRLAGYDFSSAEDSRSPWQMPLEGRSLAEAWTFGLFDWLIQGYWKPWLRAQIYGYPPLPPSKSNLDLWLGAMNWSAIEYLAIEDCQDAEEIVEKLPSRLHSLRNLESTNVSFIEELPNNTLEGLIWIGSHEPGDLASILERQGATLQKLEFRLDEMNYYSIQNKFNISILPEMAPSLTHLSINILRNGSWPLDSLQTLALIPQLKSLEVYSNLESECQKRKPGLSSGKWLQWRLEHGEGYCIGEDEFQKPLLNEDSAAEIYSFIKEANVGGMLQNVTFRIGDWTPPWDGPLYEPPWMVCRKVEIVCSANSKVDGEKNCEKVQSYGYWPPESNTKSGLSWMCED